MDFYIFNMCDKNFIGYVLLTLHVMAQLAAEEFECPTDLGGATWHLRNSRCYGVFSPLLQWQDALETCERYGAALMVPYGYEDLKLISDVTENVQDGGVWIGFNDDPLKVKKAFWHGNQPGSAFEEKCPFVMSDTTYWPYRTGWRMDHCRSTRSFICQADACLKDFFRCANGKCIRRETCDSINDCGDNSDESDCSGAMRYYFAAIAGNINLQGRYYPNENSQWVIDAPAGTKLTIKFVSFGTERHIDEVQVWLGGLTESTADLAGKLSGQILPGDLPTYHSPNNMGFIQLRSDAANQDSGFEAAWTTVSIGADLDDHLTAISSKTTTESEMYPDTLLPSTRHTWIIRGTDKRIPITVEMVDFDIGADDFLEFRDGDSLYSEVLMRLEMEDTAYPVMSTGYTISVYLHTTSPRYKRGIQFTYIQKCGGTLNEPDGYVTSPGYHLNGYPDIVHCEWIILSATGQTLSLKFVEDFSLEDDKDYVQVYDGRDFTGILLTNSTGSIITNGPLFVSTTGSFFIRFTSSAFVNDKGFKAAYSSGCLEPPFEEPTMYDEPVETSLGATVNVSCPEGYYFAQEEHMGKVEMIMTCDIGGWNVDVLPQCEPVYCGHVPHIEHGHVNDFVGVRYTDVVVYECDNGYSFSGTEEITCQQDGQWTASPECLAVICTPLTTPDFGSKHIQNGDEVTYGSIVSFSCDPGYELTGAPVRLCQDDQWSGTDVVCVKVQCPPYPVEYGTGSSDYTDFGDTVTVFCDDGFGLIGSSELICTYNRTYDSDASCEDVDECTDSPCEHMCKNTFGSFNCSCQEGYTLTSEVSCTDINECDDHFCDQSCGNLDGTYICSCANIGYSLYVANGTNGFYIPSGESGTLAGDIYRLDHSCTRLSCNRPAPPENGQLLTTHSLFHIRDIVYFHCDLGYVLEPDTYSMTCVDENTWSSTVVPNCQVATCELPDVSRFGERAPSFSTSDLVDYGSNVTVTCTHARPSPIVFNKTCEYHVETDSYLLYMGTSPECPIIDCGPPDEAEVQGGDYVGLTDTKYGATFSVNCTRLNAQLGGTDYPGDDQVVQCGEDGNWNFGSILCRGKKCSDPGTPSGGQQIPESTYQDEAIVNFRCDRPGYTLSDPYPLLCQVNSAGDDVEWNNTVPVCSDTQAPVFTSFPESLIKVDRLSAVNYTVPEITDNSGSQTSLIVTVDPANFRPGIVMTADQSVTYTATDTVGLQSVYTFDIYIKDDVTPEITSCAEPFTYVLTRPGPEIVDYEAMGLTAVAEDKSRADRQPGDVIITYDPPSLTFTKADLGGTFTVTASAADEDDNVANCTFQVYVSADLCEHFAPKQPPNGLLICADDPIICDVFCFNGYRMYDPLGETSTLIQCSNKTHPEWDRPPACVEPIPAEYWVTLYPDNYVSDSGNINISSCGQYYTQILIQRVQAAGSNVSDDLSKLYDDLDVTLTPVIDSAQAFKITQTNETELSVIFTYVIETDPSTPSKLEAIADLVSALIFAEATSAVSIFTLDSKGGCPTLKSDASKKTEATTNGYECDTYGFYHSNSKSCIPCPHGTYYTGSTCEECDYGQYQDQTHQLTCKTCDDFTWTRNKGSRSKDDCEDMCAMYNMVSSSMLPPCEECPVNTYAVNSTHCQPCPDDTITVGGGKADPSDCQERCQAGSFSATGFEPCTSCPLNFYQDTSGESHCTECPTGEITSATGSQVCENADILCTENFCNDNGDCSIDQHIPVCDCTEGFTGARCESVIDFCESQPCYNGGTCNLVISSYTCHCPSGFTGTNCETHPDNCENVVCENGGMCQDLTTTFKCLCLEGHGGETCADAQKECDNSPCENGATCVDLNPVRYECECSDGYAGSMCSHDIDECSSNPCLFDGTCVDGVNGYRCDCRDGYTGSRCEVLPDTCRGSVCSTTGECLYDHQANQELCICNNGYVAEPNGVFMNVLTDFAFRGLSVGQCTKEDYCTSNPCENDGECVSEVTGFRCDCRSGYSGSICQHFTCEEDYCHNGGSCVAHLDELSCICAQGYTGDLCEVDLVACDCVLSNSDTALNQEGCVDDTHGSLICSCRVGYTGSRCETKIDNCASRPCHHGGDCESLADTYSCTCAEGYTGDNCDDILDNCADQPCRNGAECHNSFQGYLCDCLPGYFDTNCDMVPDICNDANPCIGADTVCVEDDGNATCQCSPERIGVGCEIVKDYCAGESVCEHGGTCVSNNFKYSCQCPFDYEGDQCQDSRDDCMSISCSGSGAYCVDGVGEHFCGCPVGKTSTNCNRDVNPDYDLSFDSEDNKAMSFLRYPTNMGGNALSVGLWILYEDMGGEGTLFTLFGLNEQNKRGDKEELIRIDHEAVHLSLDGTPISVDFNPYKINDRTWIYLMIIWDGELGSLNVWVSGVRAAYLNNYGTETQLPTFGWIVLGAKYDDDDDEAEIESGMHGKISQVKLWSRSLVITEMQKLSANRTNVVTGDLELPWFVNYELHGGVTILSPSTAGEKVCPVGFGGSDCSTVLPSKVGPTIECPEDIIIQSDERRTPVTWNEPVTTGKLSGSPISTFLSGRVFIWGKWTNTYIVKDDDDNAATCSFDIYVRYKNCEVPIFDDDTHNRVCDSPSTEEDPFITCTLSCTDQGKDFSIAPPDFYTCGPEGSFNVENIFLPFSFPQCTDADTSLVLFYFRIVYRDISPCSSVIGINGFQALILKDFIEVLDASYGITRGDPQGGFCLSSPCEDALIINSSCVETSSLRRRKRQTSNDVLVDVSMTSLQNVLCSAEGCYSLRDILLAAIYDGSGLDFSDTIPGGFPDLSGLVITINPACEEGELLVGDQCMKCAAGQSHNILDDRCEYCPIGTFQNEIGQTTCQDCPDGETTAAVGSTAEADCYQICLAGSYHDTDQCTPCEVGFYQNMAGQFFCEPCDAQQSTPSEGSDDVTDCFNECPDGTELEADGNCTQCPQGWYRTVGLHDDCQQCPQSWTTMDVGNHLEEDCNLRDCQAGFHINATGRSCVECDIGFYQPEALQYNCIECGTAYTTLQVASQSTEDCKFFCAEGYEERNEACYECNKGTYKDNSVPGALCLFCEIGLTTESAASTHADNCTVRICSVGEQPSLDGQDCEPCPRGTWQDEAEQPACKPCMPETGTADTGAITQDKCFAACADGQELIGGSCEACERAYYKNNTKDPYAMCSACVDLITLATGSTSENECNIANCSAGTYRNASSNTCEDCPRGTYEGDKWQETCSGTCLDPKTTVGGAVSVDECLLICSAGEEDKGDVCEPCEKGMYKDSEGPSECEPCPGGYTTESTGALSRNHCNVELCEPGYYADLSGDRMCHPCVKGEYQDLGDQTICISCGPSSTTLQEASNERSLCIPNCDDGEGYVAETGQCELCPIGYYRTQGVEDLCTRCTDVTKVTGEPGATEDSDCVYDNCTVGERRNGLGCLPCDRGTYQDDDHLWQQKCQLCENVTTTEDVMSVSKDQCVEECGEGYELIDGNCEACDIGYYRVSSDSFYCVMCPEDTITEEKGSMSKDDCNRGNCSAGYYAEGPACEPCGLGRYQPDKWQDECLSCGPDMTTVDENSTSMEQCISTLECEFDPNPCSGEGEICKELDNAATDTGYVCECDESTHIGEPGSCTLHCDYPDYCMNNALGCTKQKGCSCSSQFYGTRCQNECSSRCSSIGMKSCSVGNNNNVSCECRKGYTGEKCENEKDSAIPYIIGGSVGGVTVLLLILSFIVCLKVVCRGKPAPPLKNQPPTFTPPPSMMYTPTSGMVNNPGQFGREPYFITSGSLTGYPNYIEPDDDGGFEEKVGTLTLGGE